MKYMMMRVALLSIVTVVQLLPKADIHPSLKKGKSSKHKNMVTLSVLAPLLASRTVWRGSSDWHTTIFSMKPGQHIRTKFWGQRQMLDHATFAEIVKTGPFFLLSRQKNKPAFFEPGMQACVTNMQALFDITDNPGQPNSVLIHTEMQLKEEVTLKREKKRESSVKRVEEEDAFTKCVRKTEVNPVDSTTVQRVVTSTCTTRIPLSLLREKIEERARAQQ